MILSKNGHLKWDWLDLDNGYNRVFFLFWLFFLLFSLFVNKHYLGLSYTIALLIITYYSYNSLGTFGTLWCWSVNSFMLYFAFELLVLLPFREHGIC